MLKQKIENGVYEIYDDFDGKILLTIKIDEEFDDQIIISTSKEVFAGSVDNIKFKED